MASSDDGIFAAYLTGKTEQGSALIVVRDDTIVGVDANGVKIDGHLVRSSPTSKAKVRVRLPARTKMIQGGTTDGETSYEAEFEYIGKLEDTPFVRVETPFGPINAKFRKLRGFDD